MGKKSTPAPPDYTGAALAEAQASKENLLSQNYANRPTQITPWGTETWSTNATTDPATGQQVTQWTQNTQLSPQLQGALDAQFGLQNQRSNLAAGFMDNVARSYAQPFDWKNLPSMTSSGMPGQLGTQLADYSPGLETNTPVYNPSSYVPTEELQRSLNLSNAPAMPNFDSSYRDRIATDLVGRMMPVHQMQQQGLETQLSNQGFKKGTAGYTRALDELAQRQAGERYNALDIAGNEAQRLYNMQMGSRQQGYNEALGAGNFANSAANQAFQQNLTNANLRNSAINMGFNQDLAARQFNNAALGQASQLDIARQQAQNQAMQQQFAMNQQYANQMNQLRQQAIAEQQLQRAMPLNEMNALLTGQQVGMPQMPGFSQSGVAQTPQLLNAANMGYQAQMDAYNARQAGMGNLMGGLFSLGSAALTGGGSKLFGF